MKLAKQHTCFAGMETVAQSVLINYFLLFYPEQTLTFGFIHTQLKVDALGLLTLHTFSPLLPASFQPNTEAKHWEFFFSYENNI